MNILKKLFKRDLVNIENLIQILQRNVTAFFYTPVIFAIKVILYSKIFIRGKSCINPQLLDFFSNRSSTPRYFTKLIHLYKLSIRRKINYGIYAAFGNLITFEY